MAKFCYLPYGSYSSFSLPPYTQVTLAPDNKPTKITKGKCRWFTITTTGRGTARTAKGEWEYTWNVYEEDGALNPDDLAATGGAVKRKGNAGPAVAMGLGAPFTDTFKTQICCLNSGLVKDVRPGVVDVGEGTPGNVRTHLEDKCIFRFRSLAQRQSPGRHWAKSSIRKQTWTPS